VLPENEEWRGAEGGHGQGFFIQGEHIIVNTQTLGSSSRCFYGEHLTHTLAEDVRHTLDSFRQDLDDSLPRQIKTVVKEVVGTTKGKRATDAPGTLAPHMASPHGGSRIAVGSSSPSQPMNLNLPQPFYHATGYGPTLPPGGTTYGPWPDIHPTGTGSMNQVLNMDRIASRDM
jgi:hypothetical protein